MFPLKDKIDLLREMDKKMASTLKSFIDAEIIINELTVKEAIKEECGFEPRMVTLLREGYDNAVFLIDQHLIFRFPRRLRSAELVQREIHLLPKIQKRVSLKIPKPIFVCTKTVSRFPFYGYEFLPGISGCEIFLSLKEYAQAAQRLGNFLRQLHSVNPSLITHKSTFERTDFTKMSALLYARYKEIYEFYKLKKYEHKIKAICTQALEHQQGLQSSLVVHGDLYNRHLLFLNNELSSIIDWGECCLSDPAVDVGIIWQFFPKEVHEYFWKAYGPVTLSTFYYSRFMAIYYAVLLLWFGDDRNDQNLIRTSLETLKNICS